MKDFVIEERSEPPKFYIDEIEKARVIIPLNSDLLWVNENLERKVDCIDVFDGMIQIWLADKED